MNKKLIKGLTLAMVVFTMVSGVSFADETTNEKMEATDRIEQIREKMQERFDQKIEDRKAKIVAFKEMTPEEKIAALEAKLENENLSDEVKVKIQNQLNSIEEREAFKAMLDELLEGKTEGEKVDALEGLLLEGELDEKQVDNINRMIERFTIGQETLDEIKAAFEGAEKEDRALILANLIESGNYSDEALKFLEKMQDKMEKNEVVRIELELIKVELEDLTREERDEKITEIIASDDYSEETINRLEKKANTRDKIDGMRVEFKDQMKERIDKFKDEGKVQ